MGSIVWQDAPTVDKVVRMPHGSQNGHGLYSKSGLSCNSLFKVIIDLQWFADALASVVGLITKYQSARDGGFINIMNPIRSRYYNLAK